MWILVFKFASEDYLKKGNKIFFIIDDVELLSDISVFLELIAMILYVFCSLWESRDLPYQILTNF